MPLAIHCYNMASRPVWEIPESATRDMMQPSRIQHGELIPAILAHSKIQSRQIVCPPLNDDTILVANVMAFTVSISGESQAIIVLRCCDIETQQIPMKRALRRLSGQKYIIKITTNARYPGVHQTRYRFSFFFGI